MNKRVFEHKIFLNFHISTFKIKPKFVQFEIRQNLGKPFRNL